MNNKHKAKELIVMRKDLGLGHKGEILITTQERVDANQEPIARDIDGEDRALRLTKRWNLYPILIDFLMKAEAIFNHAILSTPTGSVRNGFTVLNIYRIDFIAEGELAASHSKKLRTTLDELVKVSDTLDEMSADDTRLDDANDFRDDLIEKLVAIMKE